MLQCIRMWNAYMYAMLSCFLHFDSSGLVQGILIIVSKVCLHSYIYNFTFYVWITRFAGRRNITQLLMCVCSKLKLWTSENKEDYHNVCRWRKREE